MQDIINFYDQYDLVNKLHQYMNITNEKLTLPE